MSRNQVKQGYHPLWGWEQLGHSETKESHRRLKGHSRLSILRLSLKEARLVSSTSLYAETGRFRASSNTDTGIRTLLRLTRR